MKESAEERAEAMRTAMLSRRDTKIAEGEYCVVVLDHNVTTPTQSFHANQEVYCPAEPNEKLRKAQIMSARELCSLHGGKVVKGKLSQRKKETAVAIEPIKAETPEDKVL